MVAFPRFFLARLQIVSPLVPPVGGAVAGAGLAALFALMPGPLLEEWVWASGVPALVAAAAPPLGTTARAVLALAGGAMTASVVWSLLYLLVGPGGLLAPRKSAQPVATVGRPDAQRDLPRPRVMTAADLGTPLMEVAATPKPLERTVPADLDQPLAAFDPASIPAVPRPAPAKVAPLARQPIIAAPPREPLAPGERIDTYVLAPPPPSPVIKSERRPTTPSEKPSIDALLRRLEEVAAQRMALGR